MIGALGAKRLLVLIFLALLLAFIYGYGKFILEPASLDTTRALNNQKSEISRINQVMENLRSDIDKFEVQRDQFNNLQILGFFGDQDRLELRQRFNELQARTGLLSAQYTINPAIVEDNEKAFEAGYKIFNTPINFTLSAMNDSAIYQFVYFLNYGFPGQVTIDKLTIKKNTEITPTVLQKIGVGDPVPIVQASLLVTLRTLVEDPVAQRARDQNEAEQW